MAKILKGNEYKAKLGLKDRIEAELPSTLITGSELGGVIDREVLEASEKAKKLILKARDEAGQIREEAREVLGQVKEEMERSKKEGYERGYQGGLEKGLEMLIRVKELRAKLFTDNEREMVKLVFEIAKKVIGREFSENDKAIMNVIRLALSDAVGEKITVMLNPKDYGKVKKNEKELLEAVETGKSLSFREDDEVQPGGCVVDTEIGTIDAQLDTQLNAIKKALGL